VKSLDSSSRIFNQYNSNNDVYEISTIKLDRIPCRCVVWLVSFVSVCRFKSADRDLHSAALLQPSTSWSQ